jgi:D-alanyl-lipoteichoic acid acyltransferase DltB (MBOAT superfamily)
MLFNSIQFIYFAVIVISINSLLEKRNQNVLLLVSSYFFYGSWNYHLLSLILFITVTNYYFGLTIARSAQHRKLLLCSCMCINFGILAYFKYMNFFIDSFNSLMAAAGAGRPFGHLHIILPVGISFFTFQVSAYVVDIYRKKIQPTRDFVQFAVFVAFFAQLVAGPIERAKHLMPQFDRRRTVTLKDISTGGTLILQGYFKKLFVADNLAVISDYIFNVQNNSSGIEIIAGLLAFTVQIYCDFSGYTDIARGVSKLLGIDLMKNFNFPYISRSPQEFWSRWHISLSTWLRDYLYISLGGNRISKLITYRNLMITMILGGLWHGANWTFVLWGAFHGSVLVAYRCLGIDAYLKHNRLWLPWSILLWLLWMTLVILGWGIFRAETVSDYRLLLSNIGVSGGPDSVRLLYNFLFFAVPLFCLEILQIYKIIDYFKDNKFFLVRASGYLVLFYLTIIYGAYDGKEFIYFQF